MNQCNNVFYISNLGQLKQVETLIEFEELSNNCLVIGYTRANLEMPDFILDKADKRKFQNIILVELVVSVNYLKPGRIKQICRIYKKLSQNIETKELYLLSVEGHYGIFAHYMKQKGVLINLLEEGTATYKFELKNGKIHVNAPAVRMGRYTEIFCTLSGIKNMLLVGEFNKIYAAFPEKLRGIFKANEIILFFAHINIKPSANLVEIIEKYKITGDDIIFVSQRFDIDLNIFIEKILDILEAYVVAYRQRVFVKHHPKESEKQISLFRSKIIARGFSQNIISVSDKAFLVENILDIVETKILVGLTSTSLIYAQKLNKDIVVHSVVPWFLKKVFFLEKQKKQMLSSHFNELQKTFDGFKIIEDAGAIVAGDICSDTPKNSDATALIDKANQGFVEKKILQAIFYYKQSESKDIFLRMPHILYNMLYCWDALENDFQKYRIIIKYLQLDVVLEKKEEEFVFAKLMQFVDMCLREGKFEKFEKIEQLALAKQEKFLYFDVGVIRLKKMLYLERWDDVLRAFEDLRESSKKRYFIVFEIVRSFIREENMEFEEELKEIDDRVVGESLKLLYLYSCKKYSDIYDYIVEIKDANPYLYQQYHNKIIIQKKYSTLIESFNVDNILEYMINNEKKQFFAEVSDVLSKYNVEYRIGDIIEALNGDQIKLKTQDMEDLICALKGFEGLAEFCKREDDMGLICRILTFEFAGNLLENERS
ncbi:Alpha-2,8-polysialyltransferase (POLYST) [Helicobacter canadensis MIT 98-5491]|nr:Alpha-2,8-polysialyltransferase (POLYST) [Helicobacter canadensis MIT 98-5491]